MRRDKGLGAFPTFPEVILISLLDLMIYSVLNNKNKIRAKRTRRER
jgi:hypothetical protein